MKFEKGMRVRVKRNARPWPLFTGEVLSVRGDFVEVDMAESSNMSLPHCYRADELERVAPPAVTPEEK